MTDTNKLKELAERARDKGDWYDASSVDAFPEFHVDQEFMVATSPDVVLWLIAEVERLRADTSSMRGSLNAYSKSTKKLVKDGTRAAKERDRLKAESDRLRQGMKGDYDIDAWLDWSKEKEQIKAQNDALQGALHAVQAEVDGNLRPLTRDLVNMVSGLNNGSHPNDTYEHCDEIERIIGAALEGAKP